MVRVESKSSVVGKLDGEWGRYILYDPARDVIVPEDVLERMGFIQTHGNKIVAREEVEHLLHYLIVWNEGSSRKPKYVALIAAADGTAVVQRSGETYAKYVRFVDLWYAALCVVPKAPRLEFTANVKREGGTWVIETPVLNVVGKRVAYYDRRYALFEVFTRIGGISDVVDKLYSIAAQHGFTKGQYGGYIRRGPISDEELEKMKEEALALIESEREKLVERWAEAVSARLSTQREETASARQALGISKPPEEPVTPEDVLAALGVKIERREERGEELVEEVAEEEAVVGGELEVAPAPAPPALLPAPHAEEVAKVEEEVVTAPAPPAPKAEELVKLYLLAFSLPSRYAAARTKYTIEEEGGRHVLVERRVFEELATVIETARREAYDELKRAFAVVPELGVWIAVTDAAVEEARRVADFVAKKILEGAEKKKLDAGAAKRVADRVRVEAWPVYLTPRNARELLQRAVAKLSEDRDELRERIERAEKESVKKVLAKKLADVDKLLEQFEARLRGIGA